MSDRPQNVEVWFGDMQTYFYHSSFVKALRSLYTRSSHLFKRVLAQVNNKSIKNKQGTNTSSPEQSKTSTANMGNKSRTKKVNPVPKPTLKKSK